MTGMVVASCSSNAKLEYPEAPTDKTVSDNYFGTTVNDPYRPLENDTAPATLEWVKAENALTESYLSKIPYREQIRARLSELNNYKKTGLPSKHKDGKYYFYENDGLQNQSVLYRTDSLNGKPEVFLDPNTLSEDGTVALQGLSFSNDGKYAAYIISRSGSDWNEIFVMDAKTLSTTISNGQNSPMPHGTATDSTTVPTRVRKKARSSPMPMRTIRCITIK